MTDFILTLSCANRPGIVASVATTIADFGGDITEASQFDDSLTGQFFMRVTFRADVAKRAAQDALATPCENFTMTWSLREASERRKVLILVSLL